jgi:uncharacterized protein (TIGR03437 family)
LLSPGFAPGQIILNPVPSRVLGQPQLSLVTGNPNYIEGRELFQPQGIALDTSATPPILYVSDTGNHRVLAWKNATQFANGAPADFVVGQRDRFTTLAAGPGTGFQSGLNSPTGLAVRNGDLYVADSGNNRVLRFPKPAAQTDAILPDLAIGQPNFSSKAANFTGAVSEKGIQLLAGNNQAYRAGLTFDSSGNLWVVDPGNRRVLRFRASDLAAGTSGPSADLELGQLDFVSLKTNIQTSQAINKLIKDQFAVPSGIAFDSSGRAYVSDSENTSNSQFSRVLVFTPPFTNGESATRVMGAFAPSSTQPPQITIGRTVFGDAKGIFFLSDGSVGVADAQFNRILIFDPFNNWPDEGTTFSPLAKAVLGQNFDFTALSANNGQAAPSASSFQSPNAAVFSGTELFVADAGNNRMVVLPQQGSTFAAASRVLGQRRFDTNAINLIEGREFFFGAGTVADGGIAIDTPSDPSAAAHLYVADTYNNRILGFRDIRTLQTGGFADLVIGQPDMETAQCNYPSNSADKPTASSLCQPIGLVVDANGNLYVADAANSRVLRFPAPFAHQGTLPQADLVLGQQNFTSKVTDPTTRTMSRPYGVAFLGNNGLAVSDLIHNRVLFFPLVNGAFTNGEAATKVFGQTDFVSIGTGSGTGNLNQPQHIAGDTDARLYVADGGNKRLVIYDQVNNTPNTGAFLAQSVSGLNSPSGAYVNPITGEFWIADTGANRQIRCPKFDAYVIGTPCTFMTDQSPVAVTQDQFGDLYSVSGFNRIAIFYPGLAGINGANFLVSRPLAPGMVASLFPLGGQFGSDTLSFDQTPKPLPLPKALADVQVLVGGSPAPLYFVSPGQINFFVPTNVSTSGNVEVQVVRQSTGQILASSTTVAMNSVSPGIFLYPQGQNGKSRQAAVLNQDNTVNSPTNPALRGTTIQIFATGQGAVSSGPADGDVPQGLATTPYTPRVVVGTCFVGDCTGDDPGAVTFSGLAPGLVGVWQINVRLPSATAPGQVQILIQVNSITSSDPVNTPTGYATVVSVK